jgi:two-component system response regulator
LKETKVLLIEDDPDHADLIIDILEAENVNKEVILMKDGREAINYLQKTYIDSGNKIHSQIYLIILDLNLPKVPGMDVLKFIKQNPKYCSIPVVILSTSSDHKTIGEAYKNGANGYITKPLIQEDFVDKITMIRNLLN